MDEQAIEDAVSIAREQNHLPNELGMQPLVRETSDFWYLCCPERGTIDIPKHSASGTWQFDGNVYSPTFTPSINETMGKPGQTWKISRQTSPQAAV